MHRPLSILGAVFATAFGLMSVPAVSLSAPKIAIMPSIPSVGKPAKKMKMKRTTHHVRNGKREVERRLRQIAAGQLTRSNGLVSREELYGRAA